MGELGNKASVNLEKYLPALEIFAGKGPVDELKEKLSAYGIKGETSVYAGPREKDGEVVLKYNIDGIPGIIRFNASGAIYEGFMGTNKVAQLSSNMAEYFIGGLLGSTEISNVADEGDAVIQKALQAGASCWVSNGTCDTGKLREAKVKADQIKQKAAESKQKAEISSFIEKGDAIWSFGNKLVKLSVEQDKGPGGIEPDDLRKIMLSHTTEKEQIKTLGDAKQYYKSSRSMLRKMVDDPSGYKTIMERKADFPECSRVEKRSFEPTCGTSTGGTEALGVNLTVTCEKFGIAIDRNTSDGKCYSKGDY